MGLLIYSGRRKIEARKRLTRRYLIGSIRSILKSLGVIVMPLMSPFGKYGTEERNNQPYKIIIMKKLLFLLLSVALLSCEKDNLPQIDESLILGKWESLNIMREYLPDNICIFYENGIEQWRGSYLIVSQKIQDGTIYRVGKGFEVPYGNYRREKIITLSPTELILQSGENRHTLAKR